jgi:erythritol transport system substrate-binding protein
VDQADSFLKTGKTGATAEKQLFDCLLITKDNVANYSAPFTLSQ